MRIDTLKRYLNQEYVCWFCGKVIKESPPDPCHMVLSFNIPENLEMRQELACHVQCLKERLHESVHLPF